MKDYGDPQNAKILFLCGERGESLFGVLAALLLSSIVFSGAVSSFMTTSRENQNLQLIASTNELAQSVADLMSFELRLAGSGMPLGQSNFLTGTTGLGDKPLPILLSSTTSEIEFRLNEKGHNSVLTSQFTPGFGSLTVSLNETSSLKANDDIYISDMLAGGNNGLWGTLTSVSANSATISSGYLALPSITFQPGSYLEKVTTVKYISPSDGGGIIRWTSTGDVRLSPRSTFSIQYLDANGVALSLPLTEQTVATTLSMADLTVTVTTNRNIGGAPYMAQAFRRIAFRNLNINR